MKPSELEKFARCGRKSHRYALWMLKRTLFNAQDGQCGICRGPLTDLFESPKLTLDHVWPKGRSIVPDPLKAFIGNILLAHETCNRTKADRPPTADQVAFLGEVNRKLGFRPHETSIWDQPIDEPGQQQAQG